MIAMIGDVSSGKITKDHVDVKSALMEWDHCKVVITADAYYLLTICCKEYTNEKSHTPHMSGVHVPGLCAYADPGYFSRRIWSGVYAADFGQWGIKGIGLSVFPERVIAKSAMSYTYAYDIDKSLGELQVSFEGDGGTTQTASLLSVAADNSTTSLIVVKNDAVVFEQYFNGSERESVNTSFSSVKSIDSLLVGLAIEDGYIKGVEKPVTDFIPEWKDTAFASITIEDLLLMRSNIGYEEGLAWFTDDAKTYYMPNLRELALNKTLIDKNYHGQFHYNNYHPLLLGIILERSTGRTVADYFRAKIWDKIGAEYDASWSLDSEDTSLRKWKAA